MKGFKKYLIDQQITTEKYTYRMVNLVQSWLDWVAKKGLLLQQAQYKHLMDFVGELQQQGKSHHPINRCLQSVGHYYQYRELPNIAQGTRLRGRLYTLPQHLLEATELDQIYHTFEVQKTTGYYYHTDKIIVGFIIYQALSMQEFLRLEVKDVQLEKGQVDVPSVGYKNSRTIPLQPFQILPLQQYMKEIRPTLLKNEQQKKSDLLFIPQAENYHLLHGQFKQLSKKVKQQAKAKLDIQIHQLSQLRHSRIALWTQQQGIRKAQYLAGFRRVSSAERYQQAHLQDLKEQVNMYHPLNSTTVSSEQ